jgi:hypothetical protein
MRGTLWVSIKRGQNQSNSGEKTREKIYTEETRNRATRSTRRQQQKTQKNRAINPKKNRANKTEPTQQTQNQERKHHTSPDFVPVRKKISSKKKIDIQKRRERERINYHRTVVFDRK